MAKRQIERPNEQMPIEVNTIHIFMHIIYAIHFVFNVFEQLHCYSVDCPDQKKQQYFVWNFRRGFDSNTWSSLGVSTTGWSIASQRTRLAQSLVLCSVAVSTYQGHGSRDVYLHFSSEFCSRSDVGAFSGVHPDWIAMNPVSTFCLGDIQWPLQHSFAAINPLTDDASASPSPISQDRDVSWRET